jgi:hydrogenase-4 component F
MGVSSVFILIQVNYKRLLAYSSIEHMGIIALGIGIGGAAGVYGALLHIMNHALSKPLMFFVSGRIQANYGSTKIENVNGVLSSMPLMGTLTFIGALSLAGTPPFNIFISEFTVLKAAADKGLWVIAALFLLCVVLVFYGMLSSFGKMLFFRGEKSARDQGDEHKNTGNTSSGGITASSVLNNGIMILLASFVIVFGFTVPGFIDSTIRICIGILGVR